MRMQYAAIVMVLAVLLTMPAPVSRLLNSSSVPSSQSPTLSPQGDSSALAASSSKTGISNPLLIEQTGYVSTGNTSARTDTSTNTQNTLSIDEAHSWMADKAGLDVWDLSRLYVVNGSFDEGIAGVNEDPSGSITAYPFGWNSTSNTSDTSTTQRSGYVATSGNFVTVEDQGKQTGTGGNTRFQHATGTQVLWYQFIDNKPYTQDFVLHLGYLYKNGPLDAGLGNSIALEARANGTLLWSLSLASVATHDVWYSTGDIQIGIPSVGGAVNFTVGLSINATLSLDPGVYGTIDATYITAYLDDVSLVGASPSDPEQVSLTFTAGTSTVPVIGSPGSGYATVINPLYWKTNPLDISFQSNASIAFTYDVHLKSHRFTNSTWTTDNTKEGVLYSVVYGQSPIYEFYLYFGSVGSYENLSAAITHPPDWENATVYDPFLSDVTVSCTLTQSAVEIPGTLLDRLGWWKVQIEGYNYAQSASVQKYNSTSDTWFDDSVFRTGNLTHIVGSIGTLATTPASLENVNVTILSPSSNLWATELIDSASSNSFASMSWYLASSNTTAGEWSADVFWNNGTEVAYDRVVFEIHHLTSLAPTQAHIDTANGTIISEMVRFTDAETGASILDSAYGVVANWSGTTVVFQPNPVHNWWEADFDTGLVGPGEFTVIVNASGRFYDNATTTFAVTVTVVGNTLELIQKSTQVNLKEHFRANLTYKDSSGTGIEDANLSVSVSGEHNGVLMENVQDLGLGNYQVQFFSNISGSYSITITGSKPFYANASDVLFILVSEYGASLLSPNGTADVINYGLAYRLVIRYQNSTGYGLAGANVSLLTLVPADGLTSGSIIDEGNGFYSILLAPEETGTFTLLFEASIINHQTGLYSFVLSVNPVETLLIVGTSTEVMAVDEACYVTLTFTNATGYGLVGATITVVQPPSGLTFSPAADLGNGTYTLNITSTQVAEYQLHFKARLENHLDATAATSLSVTLIPTQLQSADSSSSFSVPYKEVSEIKLFFLRIDNDRKPVSNITGADLELTGYAEGFLEWEIVPVGDFYMLYVSSPYTGSYDLILAANLTSYQTQTLHLSVSFTRIETSIYASGATTGYVDRDFVIEFKYEVASNHSTIPNANFTLSGTGSAEATISRLANGNYSLVFHPESPGHYSMDIDFQKYGFRAASSSFSFIVAEIPIKVTLSSLVWKQGQPFSINVTLAEEDTGLPVSGATVTCELQKDSNTLATWTLEESVSSPGVYGGTVDAPWSDSGISIGISIAKTNYVSTLSSDTRTVDTQSDPNLLLDELYFVWLPRVFLAVAIVIGSALGLNYDRRRRRHRRQEAYEIKSRFDDANNLLSVLILHKGSGLPVYSKVLKGGFEEGMVSAFITAITHFRTEIDENGGEQGLEWHVTPISDIVRAIPTENLICAFITLSSASLAHEARMLVFAHAIGMKLDDQMELPPTSVLGSDVYSWITEMFNRHLDGDLLKYYALSPEVKKMRKFRPFWDAKATMDLGDAFVLTELARGLMSVGMDEGRAYKLIFEAIEKGILTAIEI